MKSVNRWASLLVLVILAVTVLSGCAAPAPQVVEKEKIVQQTVVVKETAVVEKVVEKQATVVVEKIVTVEPTKAPSAEDARGRQNIIVASSSDMSTLDPAQMFSRFEGSVADHVLQALTFRAPDMSIVPMLATEWSRVDDTTWEFKLRPDVKFSNGAAFNAESVKYSIDYLNKRNEEGKPLGGSTVAIPSAEITNVEAVDDLTVRLTTKSPKVLLPLYLAQIPMLDPGFYANASDEERAKQMIGTGPYVVAEHVRDSHIKLTANPDYWGEKPKVDELLFRIIPEKAVQIAELEVGNIDIAPVLPFDQAQLLKDSPGIRLESREGGRRVLMGIKTKGGNKALEDPKVRQALNYAIDFDAINEGLFGGAARRMSYVFNPPNANSGLQPYTYDPEKAKALLAEAGYPDGLELDAIIAPKGRWVLDYEIAQAVKAQLEEVGVKFKDGLVVYEWGVYRQKLLDHNLPDIFMNASGGEFELAGEAADLTSTSPSDFYEWNNPDYEALWTQLQGEQDEAKRYEIGQKMQQIILDDAPWIFLYNQLDTYGINDRIDWTPRIDEMIHLWNVSIK
jgi:peptide/nickel transport system substrate-binding protein